MTDLFLKQFPILEPLLVATSGLTGTDLIVGISCFLVVKFGCHLLPNKRIALYAKKVEDWGNPLFVALGEKVSRFLKNRLPKVVSPLLENLEEGIISTVLILISSLLQIISKFPLKIVEGLTKDNKKKVVK